MLRLVLTTLRIATVIWPRNSALRRVLIGVFAITVGFLGYQGYVWLHGTKNTLPPDQAAALRAAVSDAIDSFVEKGGVLPARVAVVHLRNDPDDHATDILREELRAREGWDLLETSPVRAFLGSVATTMVNATSVDECLRPGSRVGIDVVFYGAVGEVSSTNGISRAALDVSAYDTRVSSKVVAGRQEAEYPPVRSAAGKAVIKRPRSLRAWIFAAIALVLPWLAAPVVWKVREAKSNAASAALMAGLLAIDALAGYILFFGLSDRPFGVALALLLCFVYNLVIAEALAHRA